MLAIRNTQAYISTRSLEPAVEVEPELLALFIHAWDLYGCTLACHACMHPANSRCNSDTRDLYIDTYIYELTHANTRARKIFVYSHSMKLKISNSPKRHPQYWINRVSASSPHAHTESDCVMLSTCAAGDALHDVGLIPNFQPRQDSVCTVLVDSQGNLLININR